MNLLNILISMISVLVSVAFYTMMERKILSYIQIRKGPNKVGLMGLLQPFSDAIKLFNKNLYMTESSNSLIFILSPLFSMILSLLMISIIPYTSSSPFDNKHNIMVLFIISSLGVYTLLMVGWASNSKYAHLGTIRSVAQMISYEVSFFLIILYVAILSSSYNFTQISDTQYFLWMSIGNLILFYFWMISCLAEVNRSPFDFAEGESELVSGFNVEFMGGLFALIFLAEYTNMIILSMISMALFFHHMNFKLTMVILMLILVLMLWIRGTCPRFRYDILMIFSWKLILPSVLMLLPMSAMFSNWNI